MQQLIVANPHDPVLNETIEVIIADYEKCKEIVKAVTNLHGSSWRLVIDRTPEECMNVSELVKVVVENLDRGKIFVSDDITVCGKWVQFGDNRWSVIAWMVPKTHK